MTIDETQENGFRQLTKPDCPKVQIPTTCVTVTEPVRGKLVSAQPKHHGDAIASQLHRSTDSTEVQKVFLNTPPDSDHAGGVHHHYRKKVYQGSVTPHP